MATTLHAVADATSDGQPAFRVGEELPKRLTAIDMQRAFRMGHSRFYVLLKKGYFTQFELQPQIGARAWSGELVARYLAGPDASRFFGRGSSRRRA